ncbi:hypothetical protein KIH74_27545 [Kineosporia sp. J2-2]|uniref:Bacterial Ig-like domain-containing protein n=1 Tax=Kineosporia corallincola TaxID=2835133 RepID=A0ABS5TNR4_9ACTN|nr:hypothetical protein [Kineosporia corallincola]MBT0772730.1 hypothetical protein [Kineosporia corallincola]
MTITFRGTTARLAAFAVPLTLVLNATPAQAATCRVSPGSVTLGTRSKNVDFDVPSAKYWTLQISDINLYVYDVADGSDTVATFSPQRFANRDAGAFAVKVKRQNGDTVDSCSSSFTLKRASSLSLSVKKSGKNRKVSGTLSRVNFGTGSKQWQTMAGQSVSIRYLNGKGEWVTAKTVKTSSKGTFSSTVALGKHRWKAVWAGSSTTGAKTSGTVTR